VLTSKLVDIVCQVPFLTLGYSSCYWKRRKCIMQCIPRTNKCFIFI